MTEAESRSLREARGCLELDMPVEAWRALEALPYSPSRIVPDVVAMRILTCAKLRKWDTGAELVALIGTACPAGIRCAAGTYHLAHAAEMCVRGEVQSAREAMCAMAAIYPEGKPLLADNKTLLSLWP